MMTLNLVGKLIVARVRVNNALVDDRKSEEGVPNGLLWNPATLEGT